MILSLRQDMYSSSSPLRSDGTLDETPKDKAGTFVSMISSEAEAVGKFVGDCISTPMVQAGTLLSVLGYMLYIEPRLGLVVLLIAVPQVFAVPMIQRRINTLVRERVRTLRRAGDLVVDGMRDDSASAASHGSEIGKEFETIYGVRLRVFKLKFGLKFLVRGRRLSTAVCRRHHGSERKNRNRHRGGLYQRARSRPRSVARADRLRAVDLRREGPIRPDRGHLGQETMKQARVSSTFMPKLNSAFRGSASTFLGMLFHEDHR